MTLSFFELCFTNWTQSNTLKLIQLYSQSENAIKPFLKKVRVKKANAPIDVPIDYSRLADFDKITQFKNALKCACST